MDKFVETIAKCSKNYKKNITLVLSPTMPVFGGWRISPFSDRATTSSDWNREDFCLLKDKDINSKFNLGIVPIHILISCFSSGSTHGLKFNFARLKIENININFIDDYKCTNLFFVKIHWKPTFIGGCTMAMVILQADSFTTWSVWNIKESVLLRLHWRWSSCALNQSIRITLEVSS